MEKLKKVWSSMRCMVAVLLVMCISFFVKDYVHADSESVYLYLHDTHSNEVSKWKLTDNITSTSYVPKFARKGYKVEGYTYDEEGFFTIPQGPSSISGNVYMLYNSSGSVILYSMPTADFHMYAKWGAITYTIAYNSDGEMINSENPTSYTVEDCIELKEPSREGYRFVGWYTDEAMTEQISTIKDSAENLVLYAKWECAHTETILKNYKEATCCGEGYTGDIYCKKCLEQIGEGEVTEPTGNHKITVTGKVNETCVEDGYTGDEYCTLSGKLIKAGAIVPATGIHSIEIRDVVDATCAQSGYSGDKYCTVCENLIEKGSVIAPTGLHEIEIRNVVDATCTTEGYSGDKYCTICENLIEEGSITDATGHIWGVGVVTTEPTEESTGIRTYKCINCDEVKEEILPVIIKECTHEQTEVKNERAADCKTSGYTGDVYCKSCGALISIGQEVDRTTEHEWELYYEKAATTDADGIKKYRCIVCKEEKTETVDKIVEQKSNTSSTTESSTNSNSTSNESNNTTTESAEEGKASSISKEYKVKKVTKLKLKYSKKKLKVSYKKVSGAKYQIQISTNKKFKKNIKTYKTSKNSYSIKNLKKGKTYYVRVRAFKKMSSKTYYGKWSAVKKIKIK